MAKHKRYAERIREFKHWHESGIDWLRSMGPTERGNEIEKKLRELFPSHLYSGPAYFNERNRKRKAQGLCRTCPEPSGGRVFCSACALRDNLAKKARKARKAPPVCSS